MNLSAARPFVGLSPILLALAVWPAFGLAQSLPAPTRLIDADYGLFEAYGLSASGSGDTLVIGAPGAFPDPLVDVYLRDGSAWTLQARLISPDGSANDFFGDAVAQDGDRLVIGAPDRLNASGAAYIDLIGGAPGRESVAVDQGDARSVTPSAIPLQCAVHVEAASRDTGPDCGNECSAKVSAEVTHT